MLKRFIFLLPAFGLALPAAAAVIEPFQSKGCRYEGAVGKDGMPQGQGAWACQDGRSYKGGFKNGRFDGKGVYSVNVNPAKTIFIEPFNVNSTKLNKMVLEGMFKNGYAHGRFNVSQNGEALFVMKFDKGVMKEAKLANAKK
ncbi:MORN repeat-containing protein [Neisseria chenwenguii]|uniref:hypothetical protein n=1 Tax=Neisseria chenwenguii TaxID=1853278 RepID=UPI000F4FED4A|nr:hypothetical protein [Neisseria chenwenguii]ROV55359.1 hypothetical protein EGS38_09925 [Neisseria chenwenguii]